MNNLISFEKTGDEDNDKEWWTFERLCNGIKQDNSFSLSIFKGCIFYTFNVTENYLITLLLLNCFN